jgi:hypothetical protein
MAATVMRRVLIDYARHHRRADAVNIHDLVPLDAAVETFHNRALSEADLVAKERRTCWSRWTKRSRD